MHGAFTVSGPVVCCSKVRPELRILRTKARRAFVLRYFLVGVFAVGIEMPQCGQRVVVLRVLRIPENRRLHRLGCLRVKVPSAYPSSRHEIDAREHACQETRAGSNTSPRSSPVSEFCVHFSLEQKHDAWTRTIIFQLRRANPRKNTPTRSPNVWR